MNAYQRDHDPDDLPPQQWPDPPPTDVRAYHYVLEEASGRTSLVLYDIENPLAWIQSSAWVALDAVR